MLGINCTEGMASTRYEDGGDSHENLSSSMLGQDRRLNREIYGHIKCMNKKREVVWDG
jgi:hypothetical protein